MSYEVLLAKALTHRKETGHVVLPDDRARDTLADSEPGFACRECSAHWHEPWPTFYASYVGKPEAQKAMLARKRNVLCTLGFQGPPG